MATSETVDGVKFTQEEKGVRAKAGRLDFLFVGADLPTLVPAYTKIVQQVRDVFGPRFHSLSDASLNEKWFKDLTREMAFTRIHSDVLGRRPIGLDEWNWDRSEQARLLIHRAANRKWRQDSEKAAALAAHLMGFSPEEYTAWGENVGRFIDR
jgi:hypothetical protein